MGKLKYMAPEIHQLLRTLQSPQHGKPVDIRYDPEMADVFALGVLLASLCCLQSIDGQSGAEVIGAKLTLIQDQYPKLHPLIVDMLHPDAGLRRSFRKLYEKLSSYSAEMKKLPFCELEFVSELKATEDSAGTAHLEKSYDEWISKGESNMKNNLYGEAIACFLKVYEMVKRGVLAFNKE